QLGGHLHHVHANDVEAVKESLQQIQQLPGGEAAELRGAGAGGVGGIQAVDIQGDVDLGEALHVAHHLLQHRRDALVVDLRGGEDVDLVAVVEVQLVGLDGADTQEVEVVAVPHVGQLRGPPLGGAVGEGVAVHLVAEVKVGVDVDDAEVLIHGPVDAPVDGDGHRVVAADHGEELARLHGLEGQLLRLGKHLVPVFPYAVPQILHLQGGDVPEVLGSGRDGVGDLPQLLGRL